MIYIVTGMPGTGKTSWVMNLYRLLLKNFIQVGGICSAGSWAEGIRDRFFVTDLENGMQELLCDRRDSGRDVHFGHFYFKNEGLGFGQAALNKTLYTHPDVLVMDEVGGLELRNKGWSDFLSHLKDIPFGTIIMVVRESLVSQVILHWELEGCRVIRPDEVSPEALLPTIMLECTSFQRDRRMPVTGIILAGGKSSRFGMDKGWVRFRDKSLISIALERFSPLCNEVVISSNSDSYQDLGYPVIRDAVPDCGPMMGIYSCLRESPTLINLVASVDTPLVPTGLYRELLRIREDAQVVVPSHGNEKFEPVIGLYERSVVEPMKELFAVKNYTLPDLFKRIRFKGLTVGYGQPFSNPSIFANINTSSDLTLLECSDSISPG